MTDSYGVGIDIGSTTVSAALGRPAGPDRPHLSTLALGDRSDALPALVFVDDDGSLVTGRAAAERGAREPARVVRLDLA
ncbi:MAG TPA: Hsp70 family protein, partial [Propionibacterium sp.]|nr:Hsp70 family protein [Propionibacterium sp.]